MRKLFCMAFTALSLLVCSGAWGATDVEFDVTSTDAGAYTSYCNQTCNVTLKNRTFTAYEWDGAIFPFTASTEILNTTFGESNWDLQEFDSFDGTTIKMKAATAIVADKPYAIRIKQTVENPTFSGVTFASSISTDFIKVTLSNNLQFWGSYFKVYSWQLVNGQSQPATVFSFLSDGTGLGNWRGWPVTFRPGDNDNSDYYGTFAWFYHPTLDTTTPALSFDGVSTGGGGGDDPGPTTLAGKIAARMQITDAPTVYIDLPGIGNQTLGEYLYKILGNSTTAEEAPYRPAKIQVVATSDTSSPHYLESFTEDAIDANGNTNLEIKVRGNSTALPSIPTGKRPYRLKFASKKTSTDGKAHKHDLLGYGYSKRNWVLLANLNDNSMLRNALTYEIGKSVGMPFCPGYKFVDLVINNEYRGTYQVSDHCEVDADRINVNADTGWYVEFQGRNDMCDYPMCFAESGMLMNINNPEPDDETNAEQCAAVINPIKDWFLNTWVKGFGAGFTNPTTGWRAYNDEESLIKFWIATELTGDYDGLMSVKAYREADGKLCWGPLWDKDLAFGNYNSMAAADGKLVAHLQQASCIQGYFDKLTQDPEFMTHAKAIMDNLVSGGIKDHLLEKIDEMAEIVSQTVVQNYQRWGNPQQPGAFGSVSCPDHQAYVAQLKEWLSARIDYVQEQFTNLAAAANTVGEFEYDVTNSELNLSSNMDKLVNVTMKNRSFTANGWNVISLPFNVDETQLKTVFGNNYELKEFTGVSSDGSTMIFQSPADNAIVAGNPYLIKPSQSVSSAPVFSNVTLSYNPPGWSNNGYYAGRPITYGNYTFTGHVMNANLYKTVKIVGSDGSLQDYSAQNSLNGSMAYITIANNAEAPAISFEAEQPVERTQMNDVPTIYIDTDATIDADNWGKAAIEVFDQNNMIGGNKTWDNTAVSVKYVGDGSDVKTSYRLKFEKKYALLGSKSGSYKQWVLESNDDDPSMLRNGLTEELGDQLGFGFTPGCQYADLVVNGIYRGTYQITDRVKVESGRILVSNKDTDWLLELAWDDEVGANDLYVAGDDTTPNIIIKNPDKDDLNADDKAALQTAVGNYFTSFWADIENNVDQTSFINWYVASEILGGYKQLSDIFVYKDNADGKLYFGPLWSNDKAYGNNANHPVDMTDLNTAGSYNGMLFKHADYGVMRTKIEALWQEQWFKDAVMAKWNAIYGESKTMDLHALLTAKIDVLAAEIAETVADNYKSTDEGGAGWTLDGEYSSTVQALKDYLTERFVYLDTKFKELSASEIVETVELIDGEPYTYTENTTVESVTYTRKFNNGGLKAWFVPFDYTITENDAENFTFYDINMIAASAEIGGEVTDENAMYVYIVKMKTGNKLNANNPYLIKPLVAYPNGYTFYLENVELKAPATGSRLHLETRANEYDFYGCYNQYTPTTNGEVYWMTKNGTLNPCLANSTMKSYRWYIKVTPKLGSSAKVNFIIEEYDSEATGIRATNTDSEIESFYTPDGVRMERPTKGLNIIKMKDGTTRKIMVK
ncbi:MAG: CotH kinase family protein [Prevotellaceae bacterium]|nr:CotH kinase family protein [Prevotellaceae bacterium]